MSPGAWKRGPLRAVVRWVRALVGGARAEASADPPEHELSRAQADRASDLEPIGVLKRFELALSAAGSAAGLSPLRRFDPVWYRQHFQPGRNSEVEPVAAYLQRVGVDRHDPNPIFDEVWYRTHYPDVALGIAEERLVCGFQHYIEGGHAEGRQPRPPAVWESWYLETYAEARTAIARGEVGSATEHYWVVGAVAGHNPHPAFGERWYRHRYPEVEALVRAGRYRCGYDHFLKAGLALGLRPSPEVDEASYRCANEDVDLAVLRGDIEFAYWHLIRVGLPEGRAWRPATAEDRIPTLQQAVAESSNVLFPPWNRERLADLAAELLPVQVGSAGPLVRVS